MTLYKLIDMASYLVFIKQTHFKCKHPKALYKCICGMEKEISIGHVKSGHTISCGCKSSRATIGERTKVHGLGAHPLNNIWNIIKQRCENPKNKKYKNWGGRGIKICDEWRYDFKAFYDWCMANGWKPGLQVDKDSKGGNVYSPNNCVITTCKENNNKRRNNFIIEYDGRKQTASEWGDEVGIKSQTIIARIKKYKWSIEDSLTKSLIYDTKSNGNIRLDN